MQIAPPKDTGVSGWYGLLEEKGFPSLQEAITADWVIVGAGWAGLAAARRLLRHQPGERVVVLDAVPIASSPAGRNSGFMIDLPHDLSAEDYGGDWARDRAQIVQNRVAIAFAREALDEYGLPAETMQAIGKINGAASVGGLRHNRHFAGHLDGLGEVYESLDAQQMEDITGSGYYLGGVYTPGCTLVQPARYIQGVARGLARDCARHCVVYESSPVVSYSRRSGAWHLKTSQGSVQAGRVILAVNGQLQRFGFYRRHLMHIFTYAVMTQALATGALEGDENWGITAADPMGTSVRRYSGDGGSRLLVRNRFTYDPALEVSQGRLRSVVRRIRRHFAVRFPKLARLDFEYSWAGRMCLTKNGAQIVEELAPNLYAACSQNGLGTTKGTLAGMVLMDRLMGVELPYLATLDARQPTRLPPEPFATLGARGFLQFRHWRAGAE